MGLLRNKQAAAAASTVAGALPDLEDGARRATWEREREAKLHDLHWRRARALAVSAPRDRLRALDVQIDYYAQEAPPDDWGVQTFDGAVRKLAPTPGDRTAMRRLGPGDPYPSGLGVAPGTTIPEGEELWVRD
ncbi:MAG TPA: hypothetical protein VGW74_09630 [Propionibacteriaceae bacterium]|nr:hypothetical protein [Propionibacteriaceae bacterium]